MIDSIAKAWIDFSYLPDNQKDENSPLFWAPEQLESLIHSNPEQSWDIINKIIAYDSSDHILANLAAGPVETLLVYKGHDFIDKFIDKANEDPLFKRMLGAVWHNNIPIDIWSKIQSISGSTF